MSPANWLARCRRYRVPPRMFCAGSTGSSTYIWPAVWGMSCMSPIAPRCEIAEVSPALSAAMTARMSSAGMLYIAAARSIWSGGASLRRSHHRAFVFDAEAREDARAFGASSTWYTPSRSTQVRSEAACRAIGAAAQMKADVRASSRRDIGAIRTITSRQADGQIYPRQPDTGEGRGGEGDARTDGRRPKPGASGRFP